jgi:mono/diheme cytochrome c family protein
MRVTLRSLILPVVAGVAILAALWAYGNTANETAAARTSSPRAEAQKKLTRGQQLLKALKACKKKKPKSKRRACESAALKKYKSTSTKTLTRTVTVTAPTTTTAGAATTGTPTTGTASPGATTVGTTTTGAATTGAATTGAATTGAATTGAATTGAATTGAATTGAATTGAATTGTTGGEPPERTEKEKIAELKLAAAASNEPTAESVNTGDSIFVSQNCSACHGVAGHGENGGPDLAAPELTRSQSVGGVMEQLIEPIGGMPSFDSKLTIQEKEQLGAFVCVVITVKCKEKA